MIQRRGDTYRILALIGCGILLLVLPYIFIPYSLGSLSELEQNPHERTKFLSALLVVGFFYLNYFVWIPRYFFTKRYGWFIGAVAACFIVIALVFKGPAMDRELGKRPPEFRMEQSGSSSRPFSDTGRPTMEKPPVGFDLSQKLFLFLLAFFLSLSVRINDRWQEAEQARLQTELSYLQAQINPHFLFNTLNSIYSLAIEKSDATANAIVQLSAFMRYVTNDAGNHRVPVSKELEYLRHYIALQKIRLDETVSIDFSVEGPVNGVEISPLILISFIENAFKYGVNPEGHATILIRILLTEKTLQLQVRNQKVRIFQEDESSGVGLTNTKTRLAFLYPDRHQLHIEETDTDFSVDLTLQLV